MKKIIICLGLVLFFVACKDVKTQSTQNKIINASGIKIVPRDIELVFRYPARFKSIQQSDIYARVEGILMEQNFKEGSFVKQGDVLFRIDPSRYRARVDQLRADVSTAKANLQKASRDFERTAKLYKQKVITVDVYDVSEFNYKTAKAKLENANAALKYALIDLDYTEVRASISGKVGARKYDVGNLVGNGNNNVLTTITQLSPIYADFAIPNKDLHFFVANDISAIKVRYVLSDGTVYDQIGSIDFLDSVLDQNTSSMHARAIVQNDSYMLTPNEFVELRLEGIMRKNAIAIPQEALMQDGQGSFVYTFVPQTNNNKQGIVKKSYVQTGKIVGSWILINSGLEGAEYVIVTNLLRLRPNASITFQELQLKKAK